MTRTARPAPAKPPTPAAPSAPSAPSAPPAIPPALAPLGLDAGPILGRGAATVVVCTRSPDGATIAVKVPRIIGDRATITRLRHEAEVLERLHHPHLVPFLGLLEPAGAPTTCGLVMPLARGGSVAGLLASCGATPSPRGMSMVRQLADALVHLHARGVVHGDVKPANILLPTRHALWLADFDRAVDPGVRPGRNPGMSAGRKRAPGAGAASAGYAAPELSAGGPPTPASDVFSASVTAIELLCGERPTDAAHAHRLLADRDLTACPDPVRDTLLAGMAADPAQRPTDGAAFADGLSGLAPTLAFGPRPRPDGRPRQASHRRVLTTAAGALAACAGVAGIASGSAALGAPTAPTLTNAVAASPATPGPLRCAGSPTSWPGPGVSLRWAVLPGLDCARPVLWHTATATLHVPATSGSAGAGPGSRYRFGAPGDALLLGDWDADGVDEAGLYRPGTGEVFRFSGWATPGAPEPHATVESTGVRHGRVAVTSAPEGPDRVSVSR